MLDALAKQGYAVPAALGKKSKSLAPITEQFFSYGSIKTSSVAVDPENVYVVQKELGYPTPQFSLLALNKYSGNEAWRYSELRNGEQVGYCSSLLLSGPSKTDTVSVYQLDRSD